MNGKSNFNIKADSNSRQFSPNIVRCIFPDLRRRMYNSNMLSKLTEKMEIGLSETSHLIEQEDTKAEVRLKSCLEELATDCHNYLQITKPTLTGPGTGKTKLDKERIKLCQREIETIGNMARNLRALVTRSSLKERFKTAQTYLQKLRFLIEDVSMNCLVTGMAKKVYPSWKSLEAESCMLASYCVK